MSIKLDSIARKLVSDAVAEAERGTSGEIVPLVVARSDTYSDTRWRVAVACALLTAAVLHVARPELEVMTVLWTEVAALVAGFALGGLPFVLRAFLPRALISASVKRRAWIGFHEHGLSRTHGHTGVLVFVSLLERRVEILADAGIHSQVLEGTWDQVVRGLLAHIKANQLSEGLRQAVLQCGDILRAKFPSRTDGTNELPNELVVEE